MKKDNIKPTNLKGNDKIDRMLGLMNLAPVNENVKRSVVELTKLGPDGKVYGIVRENHKYFIKITNKKQNLIAEDFMYIGGLKNKTDKVYNSYSEATKQLNLKFLSIQEALDKHGDVNVLLNDNLLSEQFDSYPEKPKPSQPDSLMGTVKSVGGNDGHDDEIIGDEGEDGNPDVDTPPVVEEGECEDCEESEELNETEKAIDMMINELKGHVISENLNFEKLSINTAIGNIKKGESSLKKKV